MKEREKAQVSSFKETIGATHTFDDVEYAARLPRLSWLGKGPTFLTQFRLPMVRKKKENENMLLEVNYGRKQLF